MREHRRSQFVRIDEASVGIAPAILSLTGPDGEALVPLPPREIKIEEVELSNTEREVYDLIFTRAKRTFNEASAAGNLMKSYTTIFTQILRLRQSCYHPVLTRNKDQRPDQRL